MKYDVLVIGTGVIGCLTARGLSRYKLNVCLVDKEADVCVGTSKANSAIIHAGYDAKSGSLKAILNVRGNAMMDRTAEELGVPFKRIGSLVLAFCESDMVMIRSLYENGVKIDVPGLRLLTADEVAELEPRISKEVVGALFAPTAGIICPYELTIGAAENAIVNGVSLLLEHEVSAIDACDGGFVVTAGGEQIKTRYIVNAAGVYADRIAAMVGDNSFTIKPRKGEYMIFDKNQGNTVGRIIFQPPTIYGKGILVTPTVDGNLLVGPTAHDQDEKNKLSTTAVGLAEIAKGALKSVPGLNLRDVINSFSGLRAVSPTGDFIIEASKNAASLIHAACIESPGLSSSPAIAEYVVSLLAQQGLKLELNMAFDCIRRPIARFSEMSDSEKAERIKLNPLYGHIICRCEMVTEGEIVEAIRRGAHNLDAVKRRTRQGMGRCQGGFCTPRVLGILARELGVPEEEITKNGADSNMLFGRLK
jgi:glycerol-3-phosphate dehydrogenase